MADVFHRTQGTYKRSVNTPDYDPAEWIINPDVSALSAVPARYWKASGDTITRLFLLLQS